MATGEEISARIAGLPIDQRKMLAEAIDVLSQCCGENDGRALVVFVPPDSDIAQLFVFNSDEAAAYDMSEFARSHMESLLLKGMPAKERLN